MKKITSLSVLALIAAGLVAPSAAFADEVEDAKSYTGTGHIKFNQGVPEDPMTPPGEDGPEIDEPEVNPNKGPLMILGVSPLEFGEHDVTTYSADPTFYAEAFTTTETESGAEISMPNFVKFADIRATGDNSYTLSAQMTKQFTNDAESSTLDGATLTYGNINVLTTDTYADRLANVQAGLTNTTQVLNETDTVEFLNVTGGGFGKYDLAFGEYTDADNETASESVMLTVPKDANIRLGDYNAEITWTLSDVL